ncbi:electron transfer flavoprotein subunit alpha/FixB family protein [Bacillus sp. B15-48]|uniref:electron transfer flavoprotein subunit alpha/FixB family protein n=1 Tax=Bacillus sp. B15-48 TaxID=1548601 RepID=UPI00193F5E42|nr:electron transfer flavoprotein subunit alpha/FixB family protein [Bacillus sp. B15-48]MBM4764684.1 electron transfer flavoprotein subunit alpha/FixB family protein [Bacillus sp. B15-48]
MNKVWVIADVAEHAYELITKATSLGATVTAYINGSQVEATECFVYGANEVKLMPMPTNTTWEKYALVLAEEAKQGKPDVVFVSATRRGKTLAAYFGGLIDVPVVTENKKYEVEGDTITLGRTIFGGLAEKELQVNGQTVIVSIVPGTFDKTLAETAGSGEVTTLPLPEPRKIVVTERREKEAVSFNLKDSKVVIGVGRGFGEQETMAYAEEIASILNGELGCTRPVTEDLHWLPEERYIGISGQVIRPNLYLCAGVSGQIQHVYGIRDSKTIVAIDKNENAPIFKVADYYIVGDLKEVLPELASALKLTPVLS